MVHIGCGLDWRFERVAERNGQVNWFDLDLPDVIDLRRKLIGGEGEGYRVLGCSVLDNAWLETASAHHQRPFLFLAEGVFMPTPRLDSIRWLLFIEALARTLRIYRFQPGKAPRWTTSACSEAPAVSQVVHRPR